MTEGQTTEVEELRDFQEWMGWLIDVSAETPSETRAAITDEADPDGAVAREVWEGWLGIFVGREPILRLLELADRPDWERITERIVDGLVDGQEDADTWRHYFKSQMALMVGRLREAQESHKEREG